MIIKRVNEGDPFSYGINWSIDEKSFFLVRLVLPLGLVFPSEYEDFASMNIFYGWRVRKAFFRFRIRRWKFFPPGTRKILYSVSTTLHALGKQTSISTHEQRLNGY